MNIEPLNLPQPPEYPKPPYETKYNSYSGKYYWTNKDGTPLTFQNIEDFKIKVAEYEKNYNQYYQDYNKEIERLLTALKLLNIPQTYVSFATTRSKKMTTTTLKSVLRPFFEISRRVELSTYISGPTEQLKAKAKEEAEKQKAKDAAKDVDDAIAFLISKGKVIGKDFTSDSALEVAQDIVFQEKIAEATKDGGYHNFSGDDNCENCAGWDGESHRCDCGNRRVCWASEGNWKDLYIYGEAH